ncbi:hypothetical protein PspLS_09964 [Pyricularia sp. CBS 133598]|nr:hypothetical protein PspLS_09964 [Pyricularia sp. CBS 133598]
MHPHVTVLAACATIQFLPAASGTVSIGTTNAAAFVATTKPLQLLSYIKRRPDMSRGDFLQHWDKVHAPMVAPLAIKFGITGYTQINAFGQIIPQNAGEDVPASTNLALSDGIASFRYPNATVLRDMLAHSYYVAVVANDEATFIDREAHKGGQVAVFVAETSPVIDYGHDDEAAAVDVWKGDESTREKYQALFGEHDRR